MAKKKKQSQPKTPGYPSPPKIPSQALDTYAAFDSFTNPILNFGLGANNALSAGRYTNAVNMNFDWLNLRSMYSCNWLARRLVEMEAEDMTREGVDITGDVDPGKIKQIQTAWDNMLIQPRLFEAISLSRLYGGALLYMHIDGQDPSTELDLETVGKDQFEGIKVLDRWQLMPSINEVYFFDNTPVSYGVLKTLGPEVKFRNETDFNNVYENFNTGITIHSSRVIRLDGDFLPSVDYFQNQLWHSSILVNMMDLLSNYNTTSAALAAAAYKASFRLVKVANLDAVIAQGKTGQSAETLQKFISKMRIAESSENVTVLSADDSLEVINYDLSGMISALDQFEKQLSGRGYPALKLFGESAQGFNATGDSETRMYYDKIRNQQEKIRPSILKLLQIIWRSEFGTPPPEDYNFNYVPLWQMDQGEKAQIAQQTTDSVIKAYEAGLIGKEVALEELLQSSDTTGVWTNITDQHISDAAKEDEDPPSPDESMMSAEQVNNLMNAQNSQNGGDEQSPDNNEANEEPSNDDEVTDTAKDSVSWFDFRKKRKLRG